MYDSPFCRKGNGRISAQHPVENDKLLKNYGLLELEIDEREGFLGNANQLDRE